MLLTVALSAPRAQPTCPDSGAAEAPLRLAVAGMVHGHVHGFLSARPYESVRVVGVAEADTALLRRRADQYDVGPDRRYADLDTMLTETRPDALVTFTHTYGHRRVVETAARYGVDVMVEKPLAVNMEHARAIQSAARTHDIDVLVNYETTWYPSTQRAFDLARTQERLGPLRKVIVRDGHRGPKEIGVGPAFLEWLTDPTLNGGGALTDFGCYGANLVTRLMGGERPLTVTAVTQQLKSDSTYRRVDDVATILLTYPGAQGLIQASWNWPFSRKDMSIYGREGVLHADNATRMRVRTREAGTQQFTLESQPPFYESAVPYLKRVVRGEIEPDGLSALPNNMIVTEILDAARRSARTGTTVRLQAE
jgi:predicted dehydrogenase